MTGDNDVVASTSEQLTYEGLLPECDGVPSRPTLATAGRTVTDYHAYIASPAWRISPARLAERKLAGNRCRLCGARESDARLEVHHNTYARLGCEETTDLCTLCAPCHAVVTCELRRRRYERAVLPTPADVTRTMPRRRLVDTSHAMRGR